MALCCCWPGRGSITGSGFTKVTRVLFGTAAGTKPHVISAAKLTAVSPRHAKGKVTIEIVNNYGASATATATVYTYT